MLSLACAISVRVPLQSEKISTFVCWCQVCCVLREDQWSCPSCLLKGGVLFCLPVHGRWQGNTVS